MLALAGRPLTAALLVLGAVVVLTPLLLRLFRRRTDRAALSTPAS